MGRTILLNGGKQVVPRVVCCAPTGRIKKHRLSAFIRSPSSENTEDMDSILSASIGTAVP